MGEFAIQGLDPILKKLKTLGPKLQKQALAKSLRKGMAIVRKDAVSRARPFDDPATSQRIWKEIVTRTNNKKGKLVGGVVVQVGVRGGAKAYVDNKGNRRLGRVGQGYEGGGNVYHWRFLEFGTKNMRAQPFMRPALENNQSRVVDTVVTALNSELDKIIAKGA